MSSGARAPSDADREAPWLRLLERWQLHQLAGHFLFVIARELGCMVSRRQRELADVIIAITALAWHCRADVGETLRGHSDVLGFCRNALPADIAQHGDVLLPERNVGAEDAADNRETFAERITRLTAQLCKQMTRGVELDALSPATLAWGRL